MELDPPAAELIPPTVLADAIFDQVEPAVSPKPQNRRQPTERQDQMFDLPLARSIFPVASDLPA